MQQSKTRTFSAFETIFPSINGYQFEVNGVQFIFRSCFILAGSVTVNYVDPSLPAILQVPKGVLPSLQIGSQVGNYGITGHSITSFHFSLNWESQGGKVQLSGATLAYASLNAFFDAMPATYNTLGELLELVDMVELGTLAKTSPLPALKDWNYMPNYSYPAFSAAPNPLNTKEAITDENLPQTVTMLSYNTSDFKYYLTCKITYHQGWVTAVSIEFYSYTSYGKKGAKASLLKTWDLTKSVDDTISFYFTNYWLSSYKVPEGTPLSMFLGGPVIPYNSMVQGGPGPVSLTFNFKNPELYSDGMLFPISGNMMALPVKKT